MLRVGSSGSAVVALQKKLGVTADGKFGPKTLAALKAYQSSHGLAADGVAGPLTMGKLGGTGGKTATSTKATSASSTPYEKTAAGQASNFGWSLAVINSNPELKALFAQATSTGAGGGWTTDHFVAKVRDTKWFKTNADTARQAIILQKADPATYNARVSQATTAALTQARNMGTRMTSGQLRQIGIESVMFGWNTDQVRNAMGKFVTAVNGEFAGGAETYQVQYQQMAAQYGVAVSATTMGSWVRSSVLGSVSAEGVRNSLIAQATSRYPSLAARLKAGETVQQIADPYIQSQAKILELNPNTISLMDKSVQSALASKDAKTGQAVTQPVWDYEQTLRNDPRYMKTQQAQDASMGMAHQVLQDWGVAS